MDDPSARAAPSASTAPPIRILLAKLGLDGHDRGIKVVMHILRDAGMEVLYTGRRARVDDVVRTALQEDVDVIGLSLLNNNHLSISKRLLEAMRDAHVDDIPVVLGGIIPKEDEAPLRELGIAGVFPVHTPPSEIVDRVQSVVAAWRSRKES
jgi:methylmalonyl-CoA mutase C-terminal domain/subunit